MHRTLVFNGDSDELTRIGRELASAERVIAVALDRGGSLKPPGDQLTVQVLNAHADEVVRRATAALKAGRIVMTISESSALVSPPQHQAIARDADEMLWEEMESGLRNHGRLSTNYIVLMVLGAIIATIGWTAREPVDQTIAFVAASIIAPGFEPIAKIAQGLVLRRGQMISRGLLSMVVGYLTIAVVAAVVFAVLAALDPSARVRLAAQPALDGLSGLGLKPFLTTAAAALAGALIVASLRDLYVTGPLLALALIQNAALVSCALVSGASSLAARAGLRLGVDMAMVIAAGVLVFAWKQRRFHRRRSVS